MRVLVERHTEIPQTYKVARACGLFNVDLSLGTDFRIEADLPLEDPDWRIGVIAGPSGSGKSTLAEALARNGFMNWDAVEWSGKPIIDEIPGDFDEVTGALASVGLGSVPSWIRPHHVLSNGERFRADLACLLVTRPSNAFVDEFTSVVDRRVAQIGSRAFAKAWRRKPVGRVVFLTPHFDILPWLEPDWVLRTSLTGPVVTTRGDEEATPEVVRSVGAPTVAEVVA